VPSKLSAEHFQNEDAAFAYVESKLWPDGPVCHHCGETHRIRKLKGKSTRPGLYKCYACRKPFTVRMGTIFESTHLPLSVWLQMIFMMNSSKKGISTQQIHRIIGGSMTTAWHLGHRIRECMKPGSPFAEPMGGAGRTVEVDDTKIGGKAENRAFGPIPPKQSVMALVERDGRVRSFHVPNITANTLQPIIGRYVSRQSRYISDEANVYTGLAWNFTASGSVNHSQKEYVKDDGITHTNTVEGYFSVLKRGIYGIYQHVSEAHLGRYLVEFDFRYSNRARLGIDDQMRADLALVGARGKRLTYQGTRGAGAEAPTL
jgi:transposase-like protein